MAEKQCSRRNRLLLWRKWAKTNACKRSRHASVTRGSVTAEKDIFIFLPYAGLQQYRHPSNHRVGSHSDRWSWWASLRCWFLLQQLSRNFKNILLSFLSNHDLSFFSHIGSCLIVPRIYRTALAAWSSHAGSSLPLKDPSVVICFVFFFSACQPSSTYPCSALEVLLLVSNVKKKQKNMYSHHWWGLKRPSKKLEPKVHSWLTGSTGTVQGSSETLVHSKIRKMIIPFLRAKSLSGMMAQLSNSYEAHSFPSCGAEFGKSFMAYKTKTK